MISHKNNKKDYETFIKYIFEFIFYICFITYCLIINIKVMKKNLILLTILSLLCFIACKHKTNDMATNNEQQSAEIKNQVDSTYQTDRYTTEKGDLLVTLVGHASLIFQFDGKIIHVDPYSAVADYSKLPKADLILLTHEHSDHLDTTAISQIKKNDTRFIMSKSCHEILNAGDVMQNGDSTIYNGITIKAVPAYNMVNKKDNGEYWHPKERGNGYILAFGNKNVYVAGDTENIPEMDNLKDKIEVAFLPKNLPYTMNDEMFIDAINKVNPRYVYPYHLSEYDKEKINEAIHKNNKDTEVLIRPMSHINK